jgi:hypothetical protein
MDQISQDELHSIGAGTFTRQANATQPSRRFAVEEIEMNWQKQEFPAARLRQAPAAPTLHNAIAFIN